MAIKITLKNSVVQDSVPTTSHLAAVGELALNANINSLGIYMRASDNSIVKMAGPGSVTTPAASTTVAGIAELATSGETTTGTDAARVVTPAGLKAVTDAERATSNSSYMVASGGTMTGALTMPNGSNSAPSVNFGDTDSGVFGGTNTVSLTAGGTTRLTADTGVSVVGTLAVTGAITSTSDLTIADKVIHSGDTDTAIRFPAANTVSVETGGSERARVDSGGRLLVGTSSSRAAAGTSRLIQVEGINAAAGISATRAGDDSNPPALVLGKTRGTSVGSSTTVQDNDALGIVRFVGADGTDINSVGAEIKSIVDGTVAGDRMPGSLLFRTTEDSAGSVSPTTRLTITSAGLVNVPDNGKFTAGASDDLQIFHDGSHSDIKNGQGNLHIRNDGETNIQNNGGTENRIKTANNAAVELYYDNAKKFETTSDGTKFSGSALFPDNQRIKIGGDASSPDLQIWHDSTDSYIVNSTNQLIYKSGTDHKFLVTDGAETAIWAKTNGAVELYHNNVKRFETSATGVTIPNTLTVSDGANLDGDIKFKGSGDGDDFFWDKSADQLTLTDSRKIRFGDSGDLEIYHSGSNSFIKHVGTGDLYLQCDNGEDIYLRPKSNENGLKVISDGATELYYDSSKKFETTSSGITVTGGANFSSNVVVDSGTVRCNSGFSSDTNLIFNSDANANGASAIIFQDGGSEKARITGGNIRIANDSGKIQLGTSQDLQIYHDGSNSYINDGGTGDLYIRGSSNVRITDTDNNKMILCQDGGEVQLYHNGSEKLNTYSGGVEVTGHINMAANSNIYTADSGKLMLGAGSDLQIYHNGSASYIQSPSHTLYIQATTIDIGNGAANEAKAKFIDNGAVELYYDNSKKFETTSAGGTLTGALTVTNEINLFNGTTNASRYIDAGLGDTNTLFLRGCSGGDANHETLAQFKRGGASQLFFDASKKLETTSSGVKVTTDLVTTGNCSPSADGGGNLGSADYSWYNVFVNNDIFIADSGRVNFGENNDLYLYHNGTSSFIDNGTGHLYIRGNSDGDVGGNIYIQALEGEHGISLIHDGAVYLYYNNSEKLQTRSDGVRVDDNLLVNTDSDDANINASSGESQFSLRGNGQGLRLSTSGPSYWNAFASADYHIRFRRQGSNTGNIYGESNGTTTFNTGSDYRLKQNVTAYTDGITKLKKLKPCEFEFKLEPGKVVDGFIAHEVTDAGFPWIVKGTKDAVESDGKIDPQSMDYSKLTPILTAALQEAIAKIEALETKVAALEGA